MNKKVAILEVSAVFLALTLIACASGAKLTDWSASLAIFIGFIYSQLSFDLAEDRDVKAARNPCNKMRRLFVMKEAIWIATFAMLQSWPLLAGALMFMAYPYIRLAVRGRVSASQI